MKSFVIRESVQIGDDDFLVILQLTTTSKTSKVDLKKVRQQTKRLLPAWIKSKIERGEP